MPEGATSSTTTMARPRTEPAPVRRRRISEAAKKSLIRKGYEDIRLEDVAQEAGIAKTIGFGVWRHGRAADDLQERGQSWTIDDLAQTL